MTMIRRALASLTILAVACAAHAEAPSVPSYRIDTAQSELSFTATVNHAPSKGKFERFSGRILFSPERLEESSVTLTVDTGSVSSSYGEVAENLRSKDWFDIESFPQAVFTSQRFTSQGGETYSVDGILKLRDREAPITLSFVLDNLSETSAHAHGSATLKRSDFGVGQGEWKESSVVADEVKIEFRIAAMRSE